MYKRKTRDVWSVEGYYCGEWEEVCEEDSKKEAYQRLREYNENETKYPHRVRKHRVRIEEGESA